MIGQTPTSPDTTLLRIDAVVADSQGRPIQDLRLADFELLIDGVPRVIRSAKLRTSERLRKESGTRVFAFFLDEFHITPGPSAARAAEAIASFVDEKVHDHDLAAVIRPLDAVRSIRFTRDRSLVHGAIASFSGRKGEFAPRTPLERRVIGSDPGTALAARERMVAANLRELAMEIGRMGADRAVVVFVSEGFSEPPRDDRASDLQHVVRAASQFHFPVYTFNPAAPEENLASPIDRERAEATLRRLATDTGGLFITSRASIAGFARVAHDTESDYSLTYESPMGDEKPHQVELRVNRPHAWVRARSIDWPAPASHWRRLAARPPSVEGVPRRVLRRSPLIDLWIGVRREPAGTARVTITWEPQKRDNDAPAAVVVRARDAGGRTLLEGPMSPVGNIRGSTAFSGRAPVVLLTDVARFTAPGGRLELDVTIFDPAGREVDREVRDFDVPDLQPTASSGPRLLPAEIVRARSERELPHLIPDRGTPAARRAFRRTDRLLVRPPAFDITGLPVRVTARLLNRSGHSISDLEALANTPAEAPTQFLVPLASLPADLYQIEIVGTNENGKTMARVSFRLVQ